MFRWKNFKKLHKLQSQQSTHSILNGSRPFLDIQTYTEYNKNLWFMKFLYYIPNGTAEIFLFTWNFTLKDIMSDVQNWVTSKVS